MLQVLVSLAIQNYRIELLEAIQIFFSFSTFKDHIYRIEMKDGGFQILNVITLF